MKRIPSDIFLEAGGSDIEGLSSLATEFRAVLRNVWLPPALCVGHGPEALRALQPIGKFRAVLDARLAGDPLEVADAVRAAAKVGAWGVTVAAHDDAAVEAASKAGGGVRLIGTLEPFPKSDAAWQRDRRTFEAYVSHVRAAAERCEWAAFYAVRVRAKDAALVAAHAPALRIFSRAAALPQPFSVRKAADGRRLATPLDLLDHGVHHPTTCPARAKCSDLESAASLLYAGIRRRYEAPGALPPLLPSVWDEPDADAPQIEGEDDDDDDELPLEDDDEFDSLQFRRNVCRGNRISENPN